jgi:exodeoxyribonuclease V beta subunit
MATAEGSRSLLNWLVAGNGQAPQDWLAGAPTPADIDRAWAELARQSAPHIALAPLPAGGGTPVTFERPRPEALAALPAPAHIADAWHIGSFSALSHGAVSEHAASDHDARTRDAAASPRTLPSGIDGDDILRFPRGPAAGDCVHAVFERVDFSDPSGWEAAIAQALRDHPQSLPGLPQNEQQKRFARMLARMLDDVTRAELPGGITLASIPLGRRLTELEFSLPSPRLAAGALNPALKALGYAVPRLTFGSLDGYLKGFIDLVFEHAGRYYVLDWKSNHLGYAAADYARDRLAQAMGRHGYHLQYLLYSLALDRYLTRRIPGYHHDAHFGGVLYLFVRGVRPNWRAADGTATGAYFHRPAAEVLRRLAALLDPQAALAR